VTAPPLASVEPAPARRARTSTRSPLAVEAAGLGAALAVALVAVAHLCLTPRAWVLFSDADSVLLPMIRGSAAAGEPQRWALSSVLFLPERALYDATAALGLGVRASLAIDAVVNLVLLYVALRIVAALVRSGPRPPAVAGALTAFAAFAAFTFLDSSAAWDSLELPSLLATTSYYSATLLATVVAAGLGTAVLAGGRGRAVGCTVALAAVTAGSVLTNPLFVAWSAVPLVAVALLLLGTRRAAVRRCAVLTVALGAGTAAGLLLRVPFASVIVRDPGAYADPSNALPTLAYLVHSLVDRTSTLEGLVSVAAIDTVLVLDVLLLVQAMRFGRTGQAVVLGLAVLTPIVVTAGTVLLGTAAVRYLQPAWFAPLLPLVLVPLPTRLRELLRAPRMRSALAGVLALAGVAGTGVTAASAATPDTSIGCVDAWITASGRTGAGLFETVRGPKAYLPDPRRLLQVDQDLRAQPWLTDRADYAVTHVSFLLTDASTPTISTGAAGPALRTIGCGRYRVLDWGRPMLAVLPSGPIEPPHPASSTMDGSVPDR
jgi:hypothetical protein